MLRALTAGCCGVDRCWASLPKPAPPAQLKPSVSQPLLLWHRAPPRRAARWDGLCQTGWDDGPLDRTARWTSLMGHQLLDRLQSEQWALQGEAPQDGRADLANQITFFFSWMSPAPAVRALSFLCRVHQLKNKQPFLSLCCLLVFYQKSQQHRACSQKCCNASTSLSQWHRPCLMTSVTLLISFNDFATAVIAMTGKPSLEHVAASHHHSLSPTPKYCHYCKTHPWSQHLCLWHFAIHGYQGLLSSELPGRSWVVTDETEEVGLAFHPTEEWQGSQLLWKRRLHWPETSSKASPLVGPCNRFRSVLWRQMLQPVEASDRIFGDWSTKWWSAWGAWTAWAVLPEDIVF